jgi:stage II sporulation protein D
MRRFLPALAAVLALVFTTSASATSTFVITGRGWGHGVGMSQWGAYALALRGWTYDQILTYYYDGTHMDTRPVRTISVLLADGRTSLRLGSDAAFKVGTKTHAAGNPLVTPTASGRIRVEGISTTFASPVTFVAGSAPLELNGSAYRGRLVVSWVSGRLRAVNRVNSEAYIKGVVAREMPSSWHAEALKAQARAALSYAFATGGHCGAYFCPDTRDQVYGGIAAETAATNAAVDATARQVVESGTSVAQTFFHSSSGGRIASSADVWGGSVAYLQTKADYDLIAANPHRFWRIRLSGPEMRRRVGLSRTPNDVSVVRNSSDRVASMTFRGPGWATVVPGGDSLRWRMAVKSNRLWMGVLTLERRVDRLVYGNATTLDVIARGLSNMTLQELPAGASQWTDLTPVQGNIDVTHRPRKTTSYRLRAPAATGSPVTISVAAKIVFDVTQPSGGLRGIVRPKSLAGRTVSIRKKQADGSWATVATTTVNADGAFRANFNVTPGTYRARIVPPSGSGLLTGTSPALAVS